MKLIILDFLSLKNSNFMFQPMEAKTFSIMTDCFRLTLIQLNHPSPLTLLIIDKRRECTSSLDDIWKKWGRQKRPNDVTGILHGVLLLCSKQNKDWIEMWKGVDERNFSIAHWSRLFPGTSQVINWDPVFLQSSHEGILDLISPRQLLSLIPGPCFSQRDWRPTKCVPLTVALLCLGPGVFPQTSV